ncbi:rRNA adenine N-6-methyltransferase family protein [Candidatus Lariskella endosymbiont of Epinotia ramella]|uniref:rRNA adenine N-6-methyltransferase family protein n=1 Tax=Candidatus Lariskella endosymbiont of Epinotia ramella TaxID=3066224 RepID=UPI0039775386
MLSCCNLKDNATVLDVGFGSGYSIALLAKIVKSVTAIESNEHMLFLAADNRPLA